MPLDPHFLTTEQVADRLGVKPATVYAYVSRGMLPSRRNAEGKGSLFEKPDVDAFVASRRRPTTPGIQTGITLIKDGSLFYRGRDACVLARTASYEAVATLLWTGDLEHADLVPNPDLQNLAAQVIQPLPAVARTTDRLRVIVAAAAAADPLRFDTTPAAVVATGRTMLATMVAVLRRARTLEEVHGTPFVRLRDDQAARPEKGLAGMLWHRLSPDDADYDLLNAALILLADHDLAASTLAARVAASTRAHPYAVVSAGLAALDGPLHGAASGLAYAMLADAINTDDPVGTITSRQRSGGAVPGFGHPLYPDGDPRATTLMEMIGEGPVKETAERMIDAMRTRAGVHPNIDFTLAVLALTHGMPADAGETIFAVGRTAGWLAHALEEYEDRPSRFRPSGVYSGRSPSI
ncbi:citrate synthase family protein [Paractinoplanes durhamensis]|uniref:citrate synthase (unknown stereospecificity) n=1 Tax=Paractinoplanes durhamensis TaxID=113563 RepID=A0ABQ3YUG9_9ACTN|nr:citrate synthase family protein [Actinoplanes durhamensis]GIE00989.1 citrate synthase [Actinoplanes durhamensis]